MGYEFLNRESKREISLPLEYPPLHDTKVYVLSLKTALIRRTIALVANEYWMEEIHERKIQNKKHITLAF